MAKEKEHNGAEQKVPVKKQPAHRLKITFDLQFTLKLIASVVVFGVCVHFLHAYQVDRNANTLLAKSKEAQAEGDLKEATQYLRAYIGFRPQDAGAVADLAQLLDQQAGSVPALRQAYFTYQEALRQDSDRDDLRRRIVTIAMLLGRPDDALRQIEILTKKTPEDFELALLAAQCHIGNRDIDLAAREYVEVLSKDQTNVEAYSGLVNLFVFRPDDFPYQKKIEDLKAPPEIVGLFRTKAPEIPGGDNDAWNKKRAESLLDLMVGLGKPKSRAYLERGRSRARSDELAKAQEDFMKALELAPNEADVLLVSVGLALIQATLAKENGNADEFQNFLDKAELYSTQGLKLPDPNPDFHLNLFRIQQLRGDLDAARKSLQDGLAAVSLLLESADLESRAALQDSGQNFRMSLAGLLISQSQLETGNIATELLSEAEAIVETYKKLTVRGNWRVTYLEARLHFARGEWLLAVPKFARARNSVRQETGVRRQIDLELGECYRQLNNPDRQIVVFRQSLEDDPFWMVARMNLARSLAAAGRLDDAIEAYRLTGNQPGAATEVAQILFRQELRLPKGKRNWESVFRALQAEEALSLKLNLLVPPSVEILRANVLLQQEKRDEAKATLEQARIDHPDSASIVNAEIQLVMSNSILDVQSRIQIAEKLLDEAASKMGDRFELRMARVRIAQELEPEKAVEVFRSLAENTEKFTAEERVSLLRLLAQSYQSVGDIEGANKMWRRLAGSNENSLEALLALFRLAAREQDEASMLEILGQIQTLEGPNGPLGNVIQAELLIRQSVTDTGEELTQEQRSLLVQARKLLQRASSQRPSLSVIPRLLGDIEEMLGNHDLAVERYIQAVELGYHSKSIVEYVAKYLEEKGRGSEADRMSQYITEKAPQLMAGNYARLVARNLINQGQDDKALELAVETAENSQDFRDKLWLSHLHFNQGERGELAENPLREATHQNPKEPLAWIALVAYLERVGRREDAVTEIEEAKTILPEEPPHLKPLALAHCYDAVNDLQQAEKYYLQALKTDPANANFQFRLAEFYIKQKQYAKANPFIDSLLASQDDADEGYRELARSRRARIIASTGNYADVQKALHSLGDSTLTSFDLRTKAQILSTRNTKTDRREHVRVLEQIAEKGAIETSGRLQLARLYEQIGEWEQSRQEFESLLKDSPEADLVMIEFAIALLRNDVIEEDAKEAKRWLDKAKTFLSDSLQTVFLEARILYKIGKEKEARATVNAFLADDATLNSSPAILQEMLTNIEGRAQLAQFAEIVKTIDDKKLADHFYAGVKFLEVRDDGQAVDEFLPLLENEQIGRVVRAYLSRKSSRLFSEFGEHAAAEEFLERSMALARQPSDNFELVSILARQNRVSEALDLCEKLWGQFDDSLVARTSVAVLRTGKPKQKDIQRVEARMTTAMAKSLAPEKFDLHLADLKDLKGEYQQAVALYEQALQTDENNLVALNNFAYISALVGKNQKQSLKAINQAIKIAGPVGSFLDTRGVIHLKDGNLKQAIKDLTYAIDENASLSTQFRLSQAYWKQGDKNKAREVFEKAREAGLSVQSVHPLEREEYEKFAKLLKTAS